MEPSMDKSWSFPRCRHFSVYLGKILELLRSWCNIYASLLKLIALQFTVALHNYSQRWHISLVESYVKDIPDGDDGSNSCDRRYLSRRLAVNLLLIEVRCLVICCCTADLVTHNIDTFLYLFHICSEQRQLCVPRRTDSDSVRSSPPRLQRYRLVAAN